MSPRTIPMMPQMTSPSGAPQAAMMSQMTSPNGPPPMAMMSQMTSPHGAPPPTVQKPQAAAQTHQPQTLMAHHFPPQTMVAEPPLASVVEPACAASPSTVVAKIRSGRSNGSCASTEIAAQDPELLAEQKKLVARNISVERYLPAAEVNTRLSNKPQEIALPPSPRQRMSKDCDLDDSDELPEVVTL